MHKSINFCIFANKNVMAKVGRPVGVVRHKIEDNIGKRFGKWTVMGYSHRTNEHYWRVRCDCGREQACRAGHLRRGLSKGCRYCRPQSGKQDLSPWWRSEVEFSIGWYNEKKGNAKVRDIKWMLTPKILQDLLNDQYHVCAYSGEELSFNTDSRASDGTASIDRIDSSKCYEASNVQWVHKDVNKMKQDLIEERFLELCRKIGWNIVLT